MMQNFGQSVGPLMMILVAVIAVLWIALPFAVFGIKRRLDAILVELKRVNGNIRPPEGR
ncbi:hypothetical protein ABRZ00_12890 [Castellaniella ginsengisoli]|uniref:CcmD family protein n=1 Tax=Castellaniella ginsengisoli TaxID=546114 RepID=A0AB39DNM6_9BURK